MATQRPKLDYIACPTDDDGDGMSPSAATELAESLGWDTAETAVLYIHESAIAQHLNGNVAQKAVREACGWNGAPPEWVSCLVATWDDYHQFASRERRRPSFS